MQRIKIFSGSEIDKVEKEINDWLSKQGMIKVLQMVQSESDAHPEHQRVNPWGVTISILYQQ